MVVRRQSFWDRLRRKTRKSLALLVVRFFPTVQQAALRLCDVDPFPFDQKYLAPPEILIDGGNQIADALIMSQVIVVGDEGRDTSTHAKKPADPQTELIINLAVITASVDRCHFEIDSRIIGLDLLKDLMLIEDAPPNGHYNMALGLRVAADAVQGAYDEDPQEWCESTWRNYGPDGVTKKGWITRKSAP